MVKCIKNILILFNKDFYKEIDIDNFETDEIIIGLSEEDTIKVNLDINTGISLRIMRTNNYWEIIEGDNVYCVINGIKAPRKKLMHGDQISVKLKSNRIELFKLNFFIDFASGKENYDKIAYFDDKEIITMGSSDKSNIFIDDELVDKNHCYLKRERENVYSLVDMNSRYSVYINGKKLNSVGNINKRDFIIICGYKFLFMEDRILFSNYNEKIVTNNLREEVSSIAKSALIYPEFIRNPRYRYNLPEEEVEIIAPPSKSEKPNWEMFLPLVSTVAMSIMFIYMMPGRAMLRVAMSGVTIAVTIMMYIIKSKQYKKEMAKRNKMYLDYLGEQEKNIKRLYDEQIRITNLIYPEMSESIETLEDFKMRLWEKKLGDDDFLSISLGRGTVEKSFDIKVTKEKWGETEDDLILKPKEIKEKYDFIDDMHINLDLYDEDGLAIIGEKHFTGNYVYNLIIQLVTYHHYDDLKIVFIYDENEDEKWYWLRWLPHMWSEDKSIRFIGRGKESSHIVLGAINNFLDSRKTEKKDKKNKVAPHFIFFVTNPTLLDKEQIANHLEGDTGAGYTPVFIYENIQLVPNNCSAIVNIKNNNEGELIRVKNAEKVTKFKYNVGTMKNYEEFSRRMAPVYVKETFSESSLPSCITLFELYDVNSSKEIPIRRFWRENQVYNSMEAPLGVSSAGEMIALNLHEKYHGPHGLVAGTTGSGKSEILQSLIVSLAIRYHPHDINFILIDYKGGGMANLFVDLPHLVGTITNLDGNQIERSLIAIKSELKRRQRIFGEYDVNHIDSYIKLYKEGKAKEAIAHLIIIADEFAELKNDQPEFMKELVSTARIGRSLGVHLILATQKPAGVVNNQIWSNSKFKLCLKVQDSSDSREVIKTDLAAKIVEPGRAYFQVGNNEIFELFQSAWSGAKKFEDDDIRKNDIEIARVSIEGIREVIYSTKDDNKGKKSITQLDETIRTIKYLAKAENIIPLDGPWLPALKEIIYLDEIFKDYIFNEGDIEAIIGFYDDPEGQKQGVLSINFSEDGNTVIVGSPGYGKTNILMTVMVSLIKKYTAEIINIYILDFGTRVLKIFEKSKHVGGVILQGENEKMKNFFRLIKVEIESRKNKFAELGVSSLKSYKEVTGENVPQIVIVVDNYLAFRENYAEYEDEFNLIARDGNTLGISIVITTTTYSSLRARMTSNYKNNISLISIEKADYFNMFAKRGGPSNYKGRVLNKKERVIEAQIAFATHGEGDLDRINNINQLIEEKNQEIKVKAKKIPMMPETLYLNDVIENLKENNITNKGIISVGMSYETVDFVYNSFLENHVFTVVGKEKTGRSNFLKNIVTTFDVLGTAASEFYIFDTNNFALAEFEERENVIYSSTQEDIGKSLSDLKEHIVSRDERNKNEVLIMKEDKTYKKEEFSNIVVIIDDLGTFVDNSEKRDREILKDIISKYININVFLIVAGRDDKFKELNLREEFVKKLKENQLGMLFGTIANQSFYTIQLRYNTKEREMSVGEGYFINKGKNISIKSPLHIYNKTIKC